MPQKLLAANLFEYALVGVGWLLLWRLQFSQNARQLRNTEALPHWRLSISGFGAATLFVIGGWLLANILVGLLTQQFPSLKTDQTLFVILSGSLAQLCLIGGALAAVVFLKKTELSASSNLPPTAKSSALPAALATCVITISVVHPVQLIWEKLLLALHLPIDKQEMIDIFRQTDSPGRLLALSAMAVILAPVGEELVFRGGFFRYLRGRTPRLVALLLPSLVFVLLHRTLVTLAPLMALSIVFSLAYERTGRISVPIIAHALFNLHTVVFLLLGIAE